MTEIRQMRGRIVLQGLAGVDALVKAQDSGWTSIDDLLKTIGETYDSIRSVWFETEDVFADECDIGFERQFSDKLNTLAEVGIVTKDKLYRRAVRIKVTNDFFKGFIDFEDSDFDTFSVKLKIRNEWLRKIHEAMKIYGTDDLQAFINDWFGTWFDNNMAGACGPELETELMAFAEYRKELKEENKAYKG